MLVYVWLYVKFPLSRNQATCTAPAADFAAGADVAAACGAAAVVGWLAGAGLEPRLVVDAGAAVAPLTAGVGAAEPPHPAKARATVPSDTAAESNHARRLIILVFLLHSTPMIAGSIARSVGSSQSQSLTGRWAGRRMLTNA